MREEYIKDISQVELFGDRVLCELVNRTEDAKTAGGIIVPETATGEAKEVPLVRVIATGPGATHPRTLELLPMPVEPGDLIVLNDRASKGLRIRGKLYVLCHASAVELRINPLGKAELEASGAQVISGNIINREPGRA